AHVAVPLPSTQKKKKKKKKSLPRPSSNRVFRIWLPPGLGPRSDGTSYLDDDSCVVHEMYDLPHVACAITHVRRIGDYKLSFRVTRDGISTVILRCPKFTFIGHDIAAVTVSHDYKFGGRTFTDPLTRMNSNAHEKEAGARCLAAVSIIMNATVPDGVAAGEDAFDTFHVAICTIYANNALAVGPFGMGLVRNNYPRIISLLEEPMLLFSRFFHWYPRLDFINLLTQYCSDDVGDAKSSNAPSFHPGDDKGAKETWPSNDDAASSSPNLYEIYVGSCMVLENYKLPDISCGIKNAKVDDGRILSFSIGDYGMKTVRLRCPRVTYSGYANTRYRYMRMENGKRRRVRDITVIAEYDSDSPSLQLPDPLRGDKSQSHTREQGERCVAAANRIMEVVGVHDIPDGEDAFNKFHNAACVFYERDARQVMRN
ncbi:hypothetical protein FOZ63_016085, partial [Perkinsus olseni]